MLDLESTLRLPRAGCSSPRVGASEPLEAPVPGGLADPPSPCSNGPGIRARAEAGTPGPSSSPVIDTRVGVAVSRSPRSERSASSTSNAPRSHRSRQDLPQRREYVLGGRQPR
jgi:hypothetical protein